MREERRDRSRAAVIIKQKTMVDADNKEGVRAPMRPRRSEERGRRYGSAMGARGERTGTPREAISAKEAAGAKDVVPRTAIDLIRALPDSFSSGRSFLPFLTSPSPRSAMSSFSIARGSLPGPADLVPSWLSYLVLLYVLCLLYVLPLLRPPASPSTLAARLPPIIIFNSPWCSASATFSLSTRPEHRPVPPPRLPFAVSPFLFKMRGPVKKLRNIISETEERLLAVPVRAAAAAAAEVLVVSASRFDAQTAGLFGKRTC